MDEIELATTGRRTTRLGFGCSNLMGTLSRRQSLRLLEVAFEAGIRHFDTAPIYGDAQAERCLGEFVKSHRADVTVTTKFGIPPIRKSALVRLVKTAVGPVRKALPRMYRASKAAFAGRPVSSASGLAEPIANPIFKADQARASLEASLKALQVERLDLWLLHEVRAIDLAENISSGALLSFMREAVRDGRVGAFGVGSESLEIPLLIAKNPEFCNVLQYDWSVLDVATPADGIFRLHHRSLSDHYEALTRILAADEALCSRWSKEVDQDLRAPGKLAALMLKASYLLGCDSIVLFSSRNAKHIERNVASVNDVALNVPALKLRALLRRERWQ